MLAMSRDDDKELACAGLRAFFLSFQLTMMWSGRYRSGKLDGRTQRKLRPGCHFPIPTLLIYLSLMLLCIPCIIPISTACRPQ
jgi:hypothetical protein